MCISQICLFSNLGRYGTWTDRSEDQVVEFSGTNGFGILTKCRPFKGKVIELDDRMIVINAEFLSF